MLAKTTAVLAIALAFAGFNLSSSAFGAGSDAGQAIEGHGFRGDPFAHGISRHRPANGYYGGPGNGLRFSGYGDRDVWGHWGTYYGPMIHGP